MLMLSAVVIVGLHTKIPFAVKQTYWMLILSVAKLQQTRLMSHYYMYIWSRVFFPLPFFLSRFLSPFYSGSFWLRYDMNYPKELLLSCSY